MLHQSLWSQHRPFLLFVGSLHSCNYQCKVYRLGQAIKHETKFTEQVSTVEAPMLLLFVTSLCSQVVGDPHHCPGHPLCHTSFNLESSWPGSVLSCSSSVYPKGRGKVVGQASTPLSWFCWYSRSCPRSVTSWPSFLGCFLFVVAVNYGDNPVVLVLCSCFDVLCTPASLNNYKGRGKVQGGVGCPHSWGLSWQKFWSIWCLGWFSRFFGIGSHSCSCRRTGGGHSWRWTVCQAVFMVFMALGGPHWPGWHGRGTLLAG